MQSPGIHAQAQRFTSSFGQATWGSTTVGKNAFGALVVFASKALAAVDCDVELSSLGGARVVGDLKVLPPLLRATLGGLDRRAMQQHPSLVAAMIRRDVELGVTVEMPLNNDKQAAVTVNKRRVNAERDRVSDVGKNDGPMRYRTPPHNEGDQSGKDQQRRE